MYKFEVYGGFMYFEFDEYKLDIDVEKNKKFYKNAENITDGCSCDGCCNYFFATELFPKEVKDFFDKLGIDCKKATEIMVWCSEDNGKYLYYGGFYHLCGSILSGEDYWKDDGTINMPQLYHISDGYSVGFSRQTALLEKDFPHPVIQMEIDFHKVPWVLENINSYK